MSVEAASGWRDHLVSAEEAVSVVRPGDKVFVGSACATPRSLVGALERLGRPGVVLVHLVTDRVGTGDPPRTRYRHRVFYAVESRFLQKLSSLTDTVAQYLCGVDYEQRWLSRWW